MSLYQELTRTQIDALNEHLLHISIARRELMECGLPFPVDNRDDADSVHKYISQLRIAVAKVDRLAFAYFNLIHSMSEAKSTAVQDEQKHGKRAATALAELLS